MVIFNLRINLKTTVEIAFLFHDRDHPVTDSGGLKVNQHYQHDQHYQKALLRKLN